MLSRIARAAKSAGRWRLRWVQRDYSQRSGGETYAYQSVTRNQAYAPWKTDKDFLEVYDKVKSATLVDVVRCYELWDLMHNLRSIPGGVLEIGVWRGGTGAILARALQRTKPTESVYLCDTFSGVVKAGARDVVYRGGEHSDTSANRVASLMESLALNNTRILKGMFPEETASKVQLNRIALCHIDVDVYQSAKDSVAWVENRMPVGAAIVFDDYGFSTCLGVTQLVDELKATGNWTSIYNLNGHAIFLNRSERQL